MNLGLHGPADTLQFLSKRVKHIFVTYGSKPLFAILVGWAMTMLVQSSSASIAIVQLPAMGGALGDNWQIALDMAIPFVLGANIGTTITALTEMNDLRKEVESMFDRVIEALEKDDANVARSALPCEHTLNRMQIDLRRGHVQRMRDGQCTPEAGLIFIDLVDNVEKDRRPPHQHRPGRHRRPPVGRHRAQDHTAEIAWVFAGSSRRCAVLCDRSSPDNGHCPARHNDPLGRMASSSEKIFATVAACALAE